MVIFSAPLEVQDIVILEHLSSGSECVKRVNEATKVGLPPDTNIGCLEVKNVSKIYGDKDVRPYEHNER
jgi:hypothetical protein